MGVIKGQHLRIVLNGLYVAYSTACTVHMSANLEDSSTKDTTDGLWTVQDLTGMSWDISCDALYSVDADPTGANGENALDMVLAKQKVLVEFQGASGESNRVAQGNKYSGYAWINDISINATNRQNTSYSLQASGTGELKKNGTVSNNQIV